MTKGKTSIRFRIHRISASAAALAAVSLAPAAASAYTGAIHRRIADQAVQALNLVRRGDFLADVISREAGQTVPGFKSMPADLPASRLPDWNRYISNLAAASAKLDLLLSDLPDPPNPGPVCANAFPSGTPLRLCRAGELPFVPERDFGNMESSACNFVTSYYPGWNDRAEFYQAVQHSLTGGLLGYYAMKPDDFMDDTEIYMMPTNILGLGAIRSSSTTLADLGIATLALPFVLVFDLFSGRGDPIGDALKVAANLDPIPFMNSLVPGMPGTDIQGEFMGFSLAGFWHFMNVQMPGQFNVTPGLRPDTGGLLGVIDGLDAVLIGVTDFTGYTVNPSASRGVQRYTPFEDGPMRRRKADWLNGVGHTEFEPTQNLALFALKTAVTGRSGDSGANGIGWALHAIGDAACPQHVLSAVGWGHAVFEAFSDHYWEDRIGNQGLSKHLQRYLDFLSILRTGFHYWLLMDDLQKLRKSQDVPLRELVTQLGRDTFASATTAGLFIPNISVEYQVPKVSKEFIELSNYGSRVQAVQTLIRWATGASVAFLAKTADIAHDSPPTAANDPCFCATGSALVGMDLAGVPKPSSTCTACGQGVFASLPVYVDGACVAACPADKPLNQNGACVATCTGTCTGTACPSDKPFVSQGQCVSTCPPMQKIVNNRECAGSCPSGQGETPLGSGYCLPILPPDPRACNVGGAGDRPDSCRCQDAASCGGPPNSCVQQTCCVARGGLCDRNEICCSLTCASTGVCLSGPGESCSTDSDCAQTTCTGGHCQPRGKNAACRQGSDCLSGDCKQGACYTGPGSACTVDSDCAVGRCWQGKCCGTNGTDCSTGSECCSTDCKQGVCYTGLHDICQLPGDCQEGVCGEFGICCAAPSKACAFNEDCCSLMCKLGLCRLGLGSPCDKNTDCESGSCISNVCCLQAGPCSKPSDCCQGRVCQAGMCLAPGIP